MATLVATNHEDHHAYDWLRRGNQPPRTGTDEVRRNGLKSRIRALVGLWERLNEGKGVQDLQHGRRTPSLSQPEPNIKARELWRPYTTAQQDPVPPPSYEDSASDLPPDYTATDAFAVAGLNVDHIAHVMPSTGSDKLDLSALEGIRSYANKKAKKAAKQAQMSKWGEGSGDEGEKKEEGADGAGGEGGGGDGDAGAGGDGGDPPGGGDGGGDDNAEDWGFGGGKKSKKKK